MIDPAAGTANAGEPGVPGSTDPSVRSRYRIAVIPGDGIGREVVPEGIRVLESASARFGFELDWEWFDWSCEAYSNTGRMLPEDGLDRLAGKDAIYLGAVGWPGVPDHVSLWGLLIPIRRRFDQYVNLRPVRSMPGVESPLRSVTASSLDLVIVRENTEGEYSRLGGRVFEGTDREMVVQESVFTRRGVDRILRYAFEYASKRPARRVTSATKSNGLFHSMPYWDERFGAVASAFPEVAAEQRHVDALAAALVTQPERFDVIVASNLFGDILSDLGPALTGGLGMAPSANLNPEGTGPSMFEPVHGSAPDIAGRSMANPIGQILAGAMMLEHLGEPDAARAVEASVQEVLESGGPRTPDLGGDSETEVVGRAVAAAIDADLSASLPT